jgi:hypothetical protein
MMSDILTGSGNGVSRWTQKRTVRFVVQYWLQRLQAVRYPITITRYGICGRLQPRTAKEPSPRPGNSRD